MTADNTVKIVGAAEKIGIFRQIVNAQQAQTVPAAYENHGRPHHGEVPVINAAGAAALVFHHPGLEGAEKEYAYHIAYGKGERNKDVCDAIVRNSAIYFCAIGGAGALYARQIKSCREIAFFDLGCESVKELELVDFPVVVGIDALGGNLFK